MACADRYRTAARVRAATCPPRIGNKCVGRVSSRHRSIGARREATHRGPPSFMPPARASAPLRPCVCVCVRACVRACVLRPRPCACPASRACARRAGTRTRPTRTRGRVQGVCDCMRRSRPMPSRRATPRAPPALALQKTRRGGPRPIHGGGRAAGGGGGQSGGGGSAIRGSSEGPIGDEVACPRVVVGERLAFAVDLVTRVGAQGAGLVGVGVLELT